VRRRTKTKVNGMTVRFWGVRGSIATPGKQFSKVGGNTLCVEIRCGDTIIIIDAGTGIRLLGKKLAAEATEKSTPLDVHVLITHTHWDHIQGFPFFDLAYMKGQKVNFYGGHSVSTLERLIIGQMDVEYFPVALFELSSNIQFEQLKENPFMINDVKITYTHLLHPGLALGFRLEYNGAVFSFLSDNEILTVNEMERYNWENIGSIMRDADLVAADCQYTLAEYEKKVGWGHSAIDSVVDVCKEFKVKKLLALHHDPMRTDREVNKMILGARKKAGKYLFVDAAREGDEYVL
jgi:phosphoribosyl 1,2-cyclic phosphodiesterase